jgi:F0F1-type ATP synthase membrane subunit c/vacuolar-type H+-ATPase subunit K
MTVTVVCLAVCAATTILSTVRNGRFLRTAAVVVSTITLATAAIASAVASPAEGSVRGVVVTLVVAIAAFGGVGLVPLVFDLVEVDHREGRSDGTADPDTDDAPVGSRPLRGGRVIGMLERIAVVGALVAKWPEGIAVVLAVKGLARYPEIRDQHAGEQFIIGTFASVLWAVAAAGVARLALT